MKNDRNSASIILYFFFHIRKPASTLKNIIAIIKVSIELAKITGLKVKLNDLNRDIFKEKRGKTDIPFVLQCVTGTFEITGCIVGDTGYSATKAVTDEFEVHCTDGTGIRRS